MPNLQVWWFLRVHSLQLQLQKALLQFSFRLYQVPVSMATLKSRSETRLSWSQFCRAGLSLLKLAGTILFSTSQQLFHMMIKYSTFAGHLWEWRVLAQQQLAFKGVEVKEQFVHKHSLAQIHKLAIMLRWYPSTTLFLQVWMKSI